MPSNPYELFLNKFGSFTDIQTSAFKAIAAGENCIISAPTGSGKTEAAILPVLHRITKTDGKGIHVLYITPLRALNRDLMKRLTVMSAELGVSISVRHGDTPTKERQLQAANPPQILITTPETLQNLFLSMRLKNALANVKTVIIDELHELYSNKRGAQLSVALERLAEVAGDYQRIGISATIGNNSEARRFLCGGRPCKSIESKTVKEIVVRIEMPLAPSKDYKEFREKFNLDAATLARIERVSDLIRDSNSTLIFANTRQVVESLGSKLLYFNTFSSFGSIGVHHSSLDRDERIKIENEFKEGRIKSIIATSSLELGIDIGAINLVIQYGSPRRVTRLIQRVGRGGHRAKETSYGVVLVANNIEALESLAIVEQMQAGEVEGASVEDNALDVLANQVCAIALEYGKISADRVYGIVKRSAVFSKLTKEDFESVTNFLNGERLIRSKEGFIAIGFRSRGYFFSNISVIPDAIRFTVKNIASNKTISSLDEEFASNYLEEGAVFITKGLPWKVVSIEKEVVFVEQSADFEAAIPDWDGEDIPVSRETAARAMRHLQESASNPNKIMNADARNSVEKFIELQKKHFVPDDETLVIEELEDHAVVHLPLGKLANEFLSKIISYTATKLSGGRVVVRATPYALIVDFGNARKRPGMKAVFDTIRNYGMESIISSDGLISNTDIFRYKFVQVCKLFGIVEKRATVSKGSVDRLVAFYRNSPITKEALRDLKKNYFDIETAAKFISDLKKERIRIDVLGGTPSPLANEILKAAYYHRELLLPSLPDQETIMQFEQKINEKKIELLCTYCGMEFSKQVIAERDEPVSCPRCKSPMVAIHNEKRAAAVKRKISGKLINEQQAGNYREAVREAGLVDAYGSRALAALAIYGIGTATAARVLKLLRKDYKQFVIDLIEAQKNFVRTKKYWK
jgi:ATP-dependent helicase Lhr and Lhr-like helicase